VAEARWAVLELPSRGAAIRPLAIGQEFLIQPPREPYVVAGGRAAVVEINGPLFYTHPLFDTYDAIRRRFGAALAGDAGTVILKINSPGGDVSGAFDTARWIRDAAKHAGKRLVSFTEAQACSSSYALASVADRVLCSTSAIVGSIGVIAGIESRAVQNDVQGVRHYIVTSGARKADGNPNIPTTPAALEAIQEGVDAMAQSFFALVAEARGIDARPLNAAIFIGRAAVDAGLVDETLAWFELEAALAAPPRAAAPSAPKPAAPAPSAPKAKAATPVRKTDSRAVRALLAATPELDDVERLTIGDPATGLEMARYMCTPEWLNHPARLAYKG
jgi:ClpP class serine protease